jgi:hypothetical protein
MKISLCEVDVRFKGWLGQASIHKASVVYRYSRYALGQDCGGQSFIGTRKSAYQCLEDRIITVQENTLRQDVS